MKMQSKTFLALLTILTVSLTSYSQALGPVQDTPDGPLYMPGEILIKFKPDVTDQQLAEVVRVAGVQSARHIHTPAMQARGDNGIIHAFTGRPLNQAFAALQRNPAVIYAETNWVYGHQASYFSSDPLFVNGSLWGMYGNLSTPANSFGSQAAEAWALGHTGSTDVVVGVIDEGIQITHPDLAANIWVNSREIAGNGIDDDGNNYKDDINGWDFAGNNSSVYDGTSDDHGTHVAGTIGAVGNNGMGVVGVNWKVQIASGKFLGSRGGTTADAIEAVDYFTALKNRGVNIVALNNSWGGGGYSQGLHDAIIGAAKANILFVAAAGNGDRFGRAINTDVTPSYPSCYDTTVGTSTETAAAYDSVISVTAIDSSGSKAGWANYGAKTVDLGAPGVGIYSTLPTDSYGYKDGTSMATPHVTGAIALYASTHPYAGAEEIKAKILGAVAPTVSLNTKTVTGGRLDLSTVITAPSTPPPAPTAPTIVSATALNYSQIKLVWTDSDNETRFEITRRAGTASSTFTVGANVTSYIDSGLAPESTYVYTISACNSADCTPSDSSPSITTPTYTAPSAAFQKVDATTQGQWVRNYGSDGYDIIAYTKLPSFATVTVAGAQITSPWDLTLDASALETPDEKSAFSTCYNTPEDVTEFYIDVSFSDLAPHRVSIYCSDPDNRGRVQDIAILDPHTGLPVPSTDTYRLSSFVGGQYLSWNIAGVVRFKVTRVSGINAVVSGIFFDAPNYVPPTPPAAPSGLAATAVSKNQINLSWVDNSSDEAGYKIERSTSQNTGFTQIATVNAGVKSFSNTGLTRNTTYYYRVRAYNANGDSAYSNTAWAKTLR